jgi:hypothetical protein
VNRRAAHAVVAALSVIFLALGLEGARRETPTVDEFAHLPVGCALLKHGAFDLYANNPPLAKMLAAAPVVAAGANVPQPPADPRASEWSPWIYGTSFMDANRERYLDLFFLGRVAILLVALLGGLVVFAWSRELFGEAAGAGAFLLYVLSPTVEAHGRLATLDAATATTLVGAFYALHRLGRDPRARRLVLAGLALGLAILTRFTALIVLPVFALLFLWNERRIGRGLLRLAALFGVSLLVVNAGYAMRGSFEPVSSYTFKSAFFGPLAGALPGWLPLPLPRELVAGLDAQKLVIERGEFGTYWAGKWMSEAPWYYEAASLFLKTPLALWILLALAAALALRGRGPRATLRQEAAVWLPPLVLLVVFSFGGRLHIGVRYLLPVLPFLFVGISRVFADLKLPPVDARSALVAAATLGLAVSAVLAQPEPLSYFNVLAGGARGGERWLIDSNLDWGQDLYRVKPYMEEHRIPKIALLYFGHVDPGLYGIEYELPSTTRRPGTYVVSVNFVHGYGYVAPDHGRTVRVQPGALAWLASEEPADTIGASLKVYVIR